MKVTLSEFKTEDLERELEARRVVEAVHSLPKRIENPDFKPLLELCEKYIAALAEGGADEDFGHYIQEVAIEAVFGKEVWPWINTKL